VDARYGRAYNGGMSKRGRLLAIDDVPSNLIMLKAILAEPEFEVVGVSGAELAMTVLAEQRFDAILLDVLLPDLDGYSLARKIKEVPSAAMVPIIFITALREENEVVRGFEAGGVDFVSKPFRPLELLHRVRTHLALKEKNEQLERTANELLQAARSRDRFFSILAHDLKNPFAGFVSLTGQLLENFDRFERNELYEALQAVGQTSQTVARLLENLLEWGRSQMGVLRLDPRPQFLVFVVEEALESHEEGFRRKRIEVVVPEEMPAVLADRNTLLVMIRNLLSNALKFTPQGGRVLLASRVDGPEVEFSVTDTGVGIPSEQVPTLFHIDSKFSTPGTNQEPGTGLGLILCAEFAARNRGSLRVESTVGQGSTFFLRLPIARI